MQLLNYILSGTVFKILRIIVQIFWLGVNTKYRTAKAGLKN